MGLSPEEFSARWLERLRHGAKVVFRHGQPDARAFIPTAIADAFVSSQALQPIGFNWELLDPREGPDAPRSALGELTQALSRDIANPAHPRLNHAEAMRCAGQFLDLFDRETRTVVSNRYDGLWNPIAGNAVEWGFVGFDDSRIALLLLTPQ